MVEFKVRVTNAAWKDIPVAMRLNLKHLQLVKLSAEVSAVNDMAEKLANITGSPVRWNWKGSLQGHYVGALLDGRGEEEQ